MTTHASDLERTHRAQRDAADPAASAWVSANAGTGKTHVLTLRALRLMLAGTIPERILALTYTKAAAAEMSKRVYDTLAQWVTHGRGKARRRARRAHGPQADAEPRSSARAPCSRPPSRRRAASRCRPSTRSASACLQRFPLEADVAPGFTILDEPTANTLQREAIDAVLALATRNEASPRGTGPDRPRSATLPRSASTSCCAARFACGRGSRRRCASKAAMRPMGCAHWKSRCGKR